MQQLGWRQATGVSRSGDSLVNAWRSTARACGFVDIMACAPNAGSFVSKVSTDSENEEDNTNPKASKPKGPPSLTQPPVLSLSLLVDLVLCELSSSTFDQQLNLLDVIVQSEYRTVASTLYVKPFDKPSDRQELILLDINARIRIQNRLGFKLY